MKTQYTIVGTFQQGEEVLLKLNKIEAVKEKKDMSSILGNPLGFVEQMKMDAIKHGSIEQIRVSKEFYDTHKFIIGDIVEIEVTAL